MDYQNIASALDFYRERGYVYVPDAPWTVGRDAYYATKPANAVDVHIFHGPPETHDELDDQFMVASGEQSFLQMMLDGQELKKHVCVTPCFRVERYNDWHKPYFMKAELINAHDVDTGHLIHVVHDAANFFEQFFSVRIVQIGDTFDIVEKGTRAELGSYGIRERKIGGKKYRWIYGTGCAEPRLSTAIMRHNSNVGR
jgi:hypothetical protein